MKILTKILNVLIVVLVISGVIFPILYFTAISKDKAQYEDVLSKNNQLTEQIVANENTKRILRDSITVKDAEINHRNEVISDLKVENANIKKRLNKKLEELSDMSLEEILNYLRHYYKVDSNAIHITNYKDSIYIIIQPRLARSWANDITKLESVSTELLGYKKQVSEYDSLVVSYQSKINLLDSTNVLNDSIISQERMKNSNFQQLLDNRNKVIKSLKIQRGIAGGIIVVVVVLALI